MAWRTTVPQPTSGCVSGPSLATGPHSDDRQYPPPARVSLSRGVTMSLKEYKPGTAFTGVIGRTFDVSSPAWPEPLRAKEGAPNVLFIVQDDTGFGQMGCYGSPIATPNIDALAPERPALQQHAHDGAVLADPVVHSDRPQSPLERDVVHHRRIDRVSGRERLHPVRERLPLRDAAAEGLQHVCARQVAPDAGRPDLGGRPVRSLAARARLRALSTGSSAAIPTSTTRSWSTTTTASSPRRRRRRAIT